MAGVLATMTAGGTTATKTGDCPPFFRAGIMETDENGQFQVAIEYVGHPILAPDTSYCIGQHPQDPSLSKIGPRIDPEL